jgi:plasmid stabilization system protein ParE
VKIEIFPRAEADIIRQFRYYLLDQDTPAVAFRFREAVIESIEQLKPHPRMGTLFASSTSGLPHGR